MKISENWLKKYIGFKLAPENLSERLLMLGLEVEAYEDLSEKYAGIVVGEVVEIQNHPNADRLTVCKVSTEDSIKQVVCGAPNVKIGQKVALALPGAIIPRNQHDKEGEPFRLESAKIRGVDSEGMMCSEAELDLGENAEGILVLDSSARVGDPVAKYIGKNDVIYEISVTPNRADCLSHIGVAREIGAIVNKKIKYPEIKLRESKESVAKYAKVEVLDTEKCPRYSARVIRNVKIGPSPKWLQDLLNSVGMRPINNVVDVTNFVLLEYGHPLHAFDYDKLSGHKIIVKTAKEGEQFLTLDGKQRTLNSDVLMICDAEKPVAIAGVMGGANTEISADTKNVLLESAYFSPPCIRRTSKYLGLSTEASYRFERGTDINITVETVNRAAQLIQELAGGEVLKGVIDVYPKKKKPAIVKVRVSRVNNIVGTALSKKEIVSLLKKIELPSKPVSRDEIIVEVPSFRNDIKEEIDIIEEVARLYGYNKIETKTHANIDFSFNVRKDTLENELREYLVGSGFNEILTISLQDEQSMSLTGDNPIRTLNPVSEEMSVLRPSLVLSAIKTVKSNLYHGIKHLRLFEIGNVFHLKDEQLRNSLDGYNEELHLLLILCGNYTPVTYGNSMRKVDILDIKGEVSALLSKFCLDNYRFIYYDTYKDIYEQVVTVEINNEYAGFFGKIVREISEKLDIEEPLYVCELKIDSIQKGWARERKFTVLPKYPSVLRDLALVVDITLPQEALEKVIWEAGKPLCKKVSLFDVYIGQQLGESKKSLAYNIEFRAEDHTLTDQEVDKVIEKIIEYAHRELNAVLRK